MARAEVMCARSLLMVRARSSCWSVSECLSWAGGCGGGYWRFLPLGLGLGMIPALAVGTILEIAFGERYLKVPLVAIGSAWMLLGYRLRRVLG